MLSLAAPPPRGLPAGELEGSGRRSPLRDVHDRPAAAEPSERSESRRSEAQGAPGDHSNHHSNNLLARRVIVSILQTAMSAGALPQPRGLYDPSLEHDACGLGFVADIKRPPTHDVVKKGIEILRRLAHRGAAGCDPCTSDGAGILLQLPHAHYERVLGRAGVELPNAGDYGVAMCFLTREPSVRAAEVRVIEDAVRHHNQKVIGWRDVPVDASVLGPIARASMPAIRQLFIGRMCAVPAFERTLFMIRKRAVRRAAEAGLGFYIASLSSKTVVYKGLSLPERLDAFYQDLREEETKSKLALVHSRFSTNTFPTWDRAHPYRRIAHNGEINTLRGNETWMRAREALLAERRLPRAPGGLQAHHPLRAGATRRRSTTSSTSSSPAAAASRTS